MGNFNWRPIKGLRIGRLASTYRTAMSKQALTRILRRILEKPATSGSTETLGSINTNPITSDMAEKTPQAEHPVTMELLWHLLETAVWLPEPTSIFFGRQGEAFFEEAKTSERQRSCLANCYLTGRFLRTYRSSGRNLRNGSKARRRRSLFLEWCHLLAQCLLLEYKEVNLVCLLFESLKSIASKRRTIDLLARLPKCRF
jgi:hypothetical protein